MAAAAAEQRVPRWWFASALLAVLVVYLGSYLIWRRTATAAGAELAARSFGMSSLPSWYAGGGGMAYVPDKPLANGLDYLFMPVSWLDRLITAQEFVRERDLSWRAYPTTSPASP